MEARAAGHVPMAMADMLVGRGWTPIMVTMVARAWTVSWYRALVDAWKHYADLRALRERNLGITRPLKLGGWHACVPDETLRNLQDAQRRSGLPAPASARSRSAQAAKRDTERRVQRRVSRVRARTARSPC